MLTICVKGKYFTSCRYWKRRVMGTRTILGTEDNVIMELLVMRATLRGLRDGGGTT